MAQDQAPPQTEKHTMQPCSIAITEGGGLVMLIVVMVERSPTRGPSAMVSQGQGGDRQYRLHTATV